MTNTKKSLLASGLSLLASCALLAGTTFAWFTDSVTNTGNKIQAGKLDISLNGDSTEKLFGSDDSFLWEPGRSQKAAVSLSNEGTLWLKYTVAVDQVAAVDTIEPQADITKVLDVYKVAKAEQDVTAADLTAENKLGTMAELMTEGGTLQADGILAPVGKTGTVDEVVYDDSDVFTLVVRMQETAGNEYQGAGVTFDVVVKATQYTYEEDGFGSSDYDADADLDFAVVRTAEQLKAMADQGGVIEMMGSVALDEDLVFAKDTVIRLNDQTITVNGSLKAPVNTTLTIEGNGVIYGTLYAEKTGMKSGTIVVNAGDDFEVVAPEDKGWAVYGGMGSTIRLNGGTYTGSYQKEGAALGVIDVLGSSTLEMRDAVVNVKADSVIHIAGIHSNASTNLLENVTVHANYSRALNFNNAAGHSVVRGGTFVTDHRADEDFYNPTIAYQGTLDISDAAIERVGVGILYTKTYPKPTEVEGLTCERCTFIPTDDEARQYLDIDYNA